MDLFDIMENLVLVDEPCFCPCWDKKFVLEKHDQWLASHDASLSGNTIPRRQSKVTVTPELPSSVKVALLPAYRITIGTLTKSIDHVLYGKFLLCRVIAPVGLSSSLRMVVDDPVGDLAVRLNLYNYVPTAEELHSSKTAGILPVGIILAIKNPWFKKTGDEGVLLRCDNPADVVIMDSAAIQRLDPTIKWEAPIPEKYLKYVKQAPTPEKAEDWKRIGNENFVQKRYLEAIEAYTKGIGRQQPSPSTCDLFANRAVAYLSSERFAQALADSEEVLKIKSDHLKAIFRKTRALWGLRKYDGALAFLDSLTEELRRNEQLKELREKTETMIAQSKHGQYPMEEIARKILREGNPQTISKLDWAEYTGPVAVRETGNGSGRGMFATKKIEAGQLLLASKAFAFALQKGVQSQDMKISKHLGTGFMSDAVQRDCISNMALKVRNNPRLGRELYKLYAGPKLGFLDPEEDDCDLVDMKRIEAIFTYNSFCGDESGSDVEAGRALCNGLWLAPAFLNHSCVDCNCIWTMYEDFLFVRAFRDVDEGQELTIAYVCPRDPYSQRQKVLDVLGFTCSCRLCEFERNAPKPVKKEINALLKKIWALEYMSDGELTWFTRASAAKALQITDRLTQLQPDPSLAMFLPDILNVLATFYFQEVNDCAKGLRALGRRFRILEFVHCRIKTCTTARNLIGGCLRPGDRDKAVEWLGVLKKVAASWWGPESAGFMEVIEPRIMKELKEAGINTY